MLRLDVLEAEAAMVAVVVAVLEHDAARVETDLLGVGLGDLAPVVAAVGSLHDAEALAARTRRGLGGLVAGHAVGLLADRGGRERLEVAHGEAHHAAARDGAVDPRADGGDDLADEPELGRVLHQVAELLLAAHGVGGVGRDGITGGDGVLVALGDQAVDLRERMLEELGADHGLETDVDADLVEHHAAGFLLADVLGGDLDGAVGERDASGVVRMQAGELVDAGDDADAAELEQLVGSLAERIADGLDEFLGLGTGGLLARRLPFAAGAEGGVVADDVAGVRDAGRVDGVEQRDLGGVGQARDVLDDLDALGRVDVGRVQERVDGVAALEGGEVLVRAAGLDHLLHDLLGQGQSRDGHVGVVREHDAGTAAEQAGHLLRDDGRVGERGLAEVTDVAVHALGHRDQELTRERGDGLVGEDAAALVHDRVLVERDGHGAAVLEAGGLGEPLHGAGGGDVGRRERSLARGVVVDEPDLGGSGRAGRRADEDAGIEARGGRTTDLVARDLDRTAVLVGDEQDDVLLGILAKT